MPPAAGCEPQIALFQVQQPFHSHASELDREMGYRNGRNFA
jgi:hypothetical protein